jgi:uncharacterized protein YxjI
MNKYTIEIYHINNENEKITFEINGENCSKIDALDIVWHNVGLDCYDISEFTVKENTYIAPNNIIARIKSNG